MPETIYLVAQESEERGGTARLVARDSGMNRADFRSVICSTLRALVGRASRRAKGPARAALSDCQTPRTWPRERASAVSAHGPVKRLWCCPLIRRLDFEAKRPGVRADAVIDTQDDDVRRSGLRSERAREVQRVEGPHGLLGKGRARAIDRVRPEPQQYPVCRDRAQFGTALGGLDFRDFSERGRPNEHAIALDERQVGRDDDLGRLETLQHFPGAGFAEQPRQHRARLGVEGQRSPRSASSSAATRPGARAGRR